VQQTTLEMGVGVELCWPYQARQKGSVENLGRSTRRLLPFAGFLRRARISGIGRARIYGTDN
jgi:transposase